MMLWQTEALQVQEALQSHIYACSRERIMRQLLESIIYERLLPCEIVDGSREVSGDFAAEESELGHLAESRRVVSKRMGIGEQVQWSGETYDMPARRFILRGRQSDGRPVAYICTGRITASFGRIRLDGPVLRVDGARRQSADSLTLLMVELFRDSAASPAHLAVFIRELEETLLKDTLALHAGGGWDGPLDGADYYEVEARLCDGHRYHPSYKSRIGFDYVDNRTYGPEFGPSLQLLWVAVAKQWTYSAIGSGRSMDALLEKELGPPTVERFADLIRAHGGQPEAYMLLPVHPWQWQRQLAWALAPYIQSRHLIVLGAAGASYRPLQSIRTLHNTDRPEAPNVKLAMSLINTSASRYLSPHSVASAPAVSQWLQAMIDGDAYLRDEAQLVLLHEYAGIVFDPPPADPCVEPEIYGVLACIWRESLLPRLQQGESAVPFNALGASDRGGVPLIDDWLRAHGAENWWRELVRRAVVPVVHLLIAHGVALESHGQNMVLIHRDGRPARAALKDFHEGYYYCREALADPGACPDFAAIHENFVLAPPDALFEQRSREAVRDTVMDALFLFNLGELIQMLEQHYGMAERSCWTIVVEELEAHRRRHPELSHRYELFDLYAPLCEVESLTRGRLFPEVNAVYTHTVANPLAEALASQPEAAMTGGERC
ncbi:IucA/IucC family siderophore biosynthesis protein [Paenibacillus sp. 598K]|uniref:IucA/IucC family protein n=1 Tax=Paenibacillus sp. 598K TaxID=1117987 RepID=UPI000FF950CF|nr:IucA/IucC family protein [Paenibacillus sp. 598K]GBF76600.1 IucA/IucC family siderophore biosynthesis protein [Paenibacillus sp. 598K]